MKIKMKRETIVIFLIIIILFVFSLFKISKAQDEKTESEYQEEILLNCERFEKLETPYIEQIQSLNDNIYEAPLGKSADYMEETADKLVEYAQGLANAAQAEVERAREVVPIILACDVGICRSQCDIEDQGYDCYNQEWVCDACPNGKEEVNDQYCEWLTPPSCAIGNPICCCNKVDRLVCVNNHCEGQCPSFDDRIDGILEMSRIVDDFWRKIRDYFSERFWPFWLYEEEYGMEFTQANVNHFLDVFNQYVNPPDWLRSAILGLDAEYVTDDQGAVDLAAKGICYRLGNPYHDLYCVTPIDRHTTVPKDGSGLPIPALWGYLDKARKVISECPALPYEVEKALRGEKEGGYVISCQSLITDEVSIRSYLEKVGNNQGLPEQGCYGNDYCKAKIRAHEEPRFPPPCAEDFFCCY